MSPTQSELVIAHSRSVRRMTYPFVRGLSKHEVDDVKGEAILALVEAARRFDEGGFALESFPAFYGRDVRKKIRRAVATIRDDRAVRTNVPPSAFERVDVERSLGLAEEIQAALSRLSPFEAWVVRERYGLVTGEPRSIRAICMDCGLNHRRIEKVLESAKDKLSRLLTPPRDGGKSAAAGRAAATA